MQWTTSLIFQRSKRRQCTGGANSLPITRCVDIPAASSITMQGVYAYLQYKLTQSVESIPETLLQVRQQRCR